MYFNAIRDIEINQNLLTFYREELIGRLYRMFLVENRMIFIFSNPSELFQLELSFE